MATLNLILDKRRVKKDGTYPLVFRVRLREKFCDIGTGFSIREEQFDSKTSSIYNDLFANQQLEDLKHHYVNRMRKYLVANVGNENIQGLRSYMVNRLPDELTIIEFWQEQIESLKSANRFGGAKVYSTAFRVYSV